MGIDQKERKILKKALELDPLFSKNFSTIRKKQLQLQISIITLFEIVNWTLSSDDGWSSIKFTSNDESVQGNMHFAWDRLSQTVAYDRRLELVLTNPEHRKYISIGIVDNPDKSIYLGMSNNSPNDLIAIPCEDMAEALIKLTNEVCTFFNK